MAADLPMSSINEEFVFSDHIHGQQEFQAFQRSMLSLGFDVLDDENEDEKSKPSEDISKIAFEKGQTETVSLVLDEIDRIQLSYATTKGMNEWSFTWGLMNCLGIAYVFGAHPGHFWILYAFESVYWMSYKFLGMWCAKPCQIFYYFDFCWIMNVWGVLFLAALVFAGDQVDTEDRRQIFMATFGIAAGPVFLASMFLPFVAFLFHDVYTMANLIIHILPAMLMYVLRWQPETMQEAYPDIFDLHYLIQDASKISFTSFNGTGSMSRNAVIVYFCWFVPYLIWMMLIGLKLPRVSEGKPPPKYDTVFHSLWGGGPCEMIGTLVWKRPKSVSKTQSKRNDFELRDFLLYSTLHFLACFIIGIHVVARLCHYSQWTHGFLIAVSTIVCARRGAQRYTYYATCMYGHQIRKHFASLEVEAKKKK